MRISPLLLRLLLNLLTALALAAPARAELVRNDAGGFTIVTMGESDMDPVALWLRLVDPASWWSPSHTWSGDSANMSFEPLAGGCWCEEVDDNGSVQHGHIIAYEPARRRVLMRAELGPLQSMPVNGWLEWQVEARDGGGSTVRWRYSVTGRGDDAASWGPDSWLPGAVDAVIAEQVGRLVASR